MQTYQITATLLTTVTLTVQAEDDFEAELAAEQHLKGENVTHGQIVAAGTPQTDPESVEFQTEEVEA
jgi:hypothetical protein